MTAPHCTHVYDAIVDIAPRRELGSGPVGQRRIIDNPPAPRYARSVLRITAPDGPHAWLNRRVFVGTLTPLLPERQAVKISVFELG